MCFSCMDQTLKERNTYRIIFIPETIGSIAYLSKNLKKMKIIAGFNLSCVGDNKNYSMIHSRQKYARR